MPHKLLIN